MNAGKAHYALGYSDFGTFYCKANESASILAT
jgi:hypothetical protein